MTENNELQRKMNKVENALEDFKEGEPLPISINDIHFLVGACQTLLSQVRKLTEAYKTDFIRLNEQADNLREDYRKARMMVCRHDQIMAKYKQVIKQVKLLPHWRRSKGLRLELASLENITDKATKTKT